MFRQGGHTTAMAGGGRRKLHTTWDDGASGRGAHRPCSPAVLAALPTSRRPLKALGCATALPCTTVYTGSELIEEYDLKTCELLGASVPGCRGARPMTLESCFSTPLVAPVLSTLTRGTGGPPLRYVAIRVWSQSVTRAATATPAACLALRCAVRKRRAKATLGSFGPWEFLTGEPVQRWNPDQGILNESTANVSASVRQGGADVGVCPACQVVWCQCIWYSGTALDWRLQ